MILIILNKSIYNKELEFYYSYLREWETFCEFFNLKPMIKYFYYLNFFTKIWYKQKWNKSYQVLAKVLNIYDFSGVYSMLKALWNKTNSY